MGLHVVLHILKQENISLDVNRLNSLLINTSIAETLEESQGFTGTDYFRLDNGILKIANQCDGYFENSYEDYTQYYGSFHEEAEILSNCLESGRVVFKLDIEGNLSEYFIITPGNVEHKEEKDLF